MLTETQRNQLKRKVYILTEGEAIKNITSMETKVIRRLPEAKKKLFVEYVTKLIALVKNEL